jgi:hypothetical protein
MNRYGVAIWVRHPRTGTYHQAAVESGFQLAIDGGSGAPGERVPREAYARTLCRMRDPDFRYGERMAPDGTKTCGHCY